MAAPSEPSTCLMQFTVVAVTIALVLLLSQVAFIADSAFTRESSLAAPALICIFSLAVASVFSTIRAQFTLREHARDGSLDSLTQSIYKRCLTGNLAALACASAALGFCIFVLRHFSN